jgi:hypothetical protein
MFALLIESESAAVLLGLASMIEAAKPAKADCGSLGVGVDCGFRLAFLPAYGVEPDAREYKCECCGATKGAEEPSSHAPGLSP